MPFFKLDDLPGAVVAPGHSTAYGPTITGNELEIGCRTANSPMSNFTIVGGRNEERLKFLFAPGG